MSLNNIKGNPIYRCGDYLYNFDHILNNRPFSLTVNHLLEIGVTPIAVHLYNKDDYFVEIGRFIGLIQNSVLKPVIIQLESEYRGTGLGLALYEAAFAHSLNHLGVTQVSGGLHSTNAHKTLIRLAEKHGLGYTAEQIGEPRGAYDDAYGPYILQLT